MLLHRDAVSFHSCITAIFLHYSNAMPRIERQSLCPSGVQEYGPMARPPKYESEAEKPVNVSLRLPRDLYEPSTASCQEAPYDTHSTDCGGATPAPRGTDWPQRHYRLTRYYCNAGTE